MDKEQVKKWALVKEALEKSGKTDSFFYKRAVSVVTTGRDLDEPLNFSNFGQ